MALVTVALLAAPTLAQQPQNEAEKLYRAMEQKIRSAKALHVVFEGDVIKDGKKATFSGTVDWVEGNKCHFDLKMDVEGKSARFLAISNGKESFTKFGEQVDTKAQAPKPRDYEQGTGWLARTGMVCIFVVGPKSKEQTQSGDIDKDLHVKDFQLGAKEKIGGRDTQVVTYHFDLHDKLKVKTSVWIDTAMLVPVKRELTAERDGKEAFRVRETFSTFEVNPNLDAKRFELPR
jgi:outer membrane lipoprotein-sorting protein